MDKTYAGSYVWSQSSKEGSDWSITFETSDISVIAKYIRENLAIVYPIAFRDMMENYHSDIKGRVQHAKRKGTPDIGIIVNQIMKDINRSYYSPGPLLQKIVKQMAVYMIDGVKYFDEEDDDCQITFLNKILKKMSDTELIESLYIRSYGSEYVISLNKTPSLIVLK